MRFHLPGTENAPIQERFAAERRFRWGMLLAFVFLIGWGMQPDSAFAASVNFDTSAVDSLFCGFIGYASGKLATMLAVIMIVFGVLGHWLGSGKVWGTLLYICLGLGLITGAANLVSMVTKVDACSAGGLSL